MKSKRATLSVVLLAMCLAWATGCGDKDVAAKKARTPNRTFANPSAPTPLEQSLARWQQGDQAGAVERFLEIDWQNGPALSPSSALSLTEKEFAAKTAQDREQLATQFMAQLSDLKALAQSVRDKGRGVATTDRADARRCFSKLAECGSALAKPNGLMILQLTAQAIRKMGATETDALGK